VTTVDIVDLARTVTATLAEAERYYGRKYDRRIYG
jgi:hypothetical protein